MTKPPTPRKPAPTPSSQRVQEVADKYRAWGYEVILEPGSDLLPDFLSDYRPDFLARIGKERVLVEVKRRATPDVVERYRELVERVHSHPGWRFDLVVDNPPDQVPLLAELPVLPLHDVSRRFEEAQQLLERNHDDAALLILWSGIEATLRLLAERNAVVVQRSATPTLLKQLVTAGVIEREQYDRLWDTYRLRNAIAHGFAMRGTPASARTLLKLGKDLMDELQSTA
jgi:hypothetical protein